MHYFTEMCPRRCKFEVEVIEPKVNLQVNFSA
jgi:hypothetical protein